MRTTFFEPSTGNFPWYVKTDEDRGEMEYFCEAELEAWRQAKAAHAACMTVEAKLAARPALEEAFKALKLAYVNIGVMFAA